MISIPPIDTLADSVSESVEIDRILKAAGLT